MESLPIVVPIRFSGGGLSMQTTTSRLSEEGAFVRCIVAPKVGAQVAIDITLPGAPRPVAMMTTVTERVAPGEKGKETGFWVRFDQMEAEARVSLETLLRSRGGKAGKAPPPAAAAKAAPKAGPAPGSDVEPPDSRRAYARIPTRLQVGWKSPKEFLVAYSENISRGGIFVATPAPPPEHEIVELLLELPDGGSPARTNAEVVQSIDMASAKATGRTAGAGLQFVGSDDEFRARLDACIEHLLLAG